MSRDDFYNKAINCNKLRIMFHYLSKIPLLRHIDTYRNIIKMTNNKILPQFDLHFVVRQKDYSHRGPVWHYLYSGQPAVPQDPRIK